MKAKASKYNFISSHMSSVRVTFSDSLCLVLFFHLLSHFDWLHLVRLATSSTWTHPLLLGCDDELLVLLGHHAAGAVGGLQHVDDQVVWQHVQFLHVIPRHVHGAGQALSAHIALITSGEPQGSVLGPTDIFRSTLTLVTSLGNMVGWWELTHVMILKSWILWRTGNLLSFQK